MFKAEMEKSDFEDCSETVCSIADENGKIITLEISFDAAEKFAHSLNELSVERCHVVDIAEDIFHS